MIWVGYNDRQSNKPQTEAQKKINQKVVGDLMSEQFKGLKVTRPLSTKSQAFDLCEKNRLEDEAEDDRESWNATLQDHDYEIK